MFVTELLALLASTRLDAPSPSSPQPDAGRDLMEFLCREAAAPSWMTSHDFIAMVGTDQFSPDPSPISLAHLGKCVFGGSGLCTHTVGGGRHRATQVSAQKTRRRGGREKKLQSSF